MHRQKANGALINRIGWGVWQRVNSLIIVVVTGSGGVYSHAPERLWKDKLKVSDGVVEDVRRRTTE